MTRRRLRPDPTPTELAGLYPTPHQHRRWIDHRIRVDVSVTLARTLLSPGGTVADLSAGDGAIAARVVGLDSRVILGDLAAAPSEVSPYGNTYDYTGPIEQTVDKLDDASIDLFLCCETLEHVSDPGLVLGRIRAKAHRLLISTPAGETDDTNPEHIWAWDEADLLELLVAAGWQPILYNLLDLRPAGFTYAYQLWGCQ